MRKIVVAVTGASGAVYAEQLIKKLLKASKQWDELAMVFSNNAKDVWQTELGNRSYDAFDIPVFDKQDFNVPFASGSGQFDTMIIVPCSMGTMGRIASGISNDLITRAADVVLKERRKLILAVRETPYNLIHIRNMETITLAGGIVCPATPSFYSRPQTVEDVIATVVDRILDLAEIDIKTYRWGNSD